MHTSKYGRSAFTKSPMISSNLRCSGLYTDQHTPYPASVPRSNSLAKNTLRDFTRHSRIHLHCHDFPTLLEYPHGKVPRSGTDFEDDVRLFQVCL